MAEEFDILAAKVLSGEATPAETTRLERLLAQDSALRAEFGELKDSWRTLKEVGPLARALEALPAEPPPQRLRQWQLQLKAPDDRSRTEDITSNVKIKQPWSMVLALAAAVMSAAIVGVVLWSKRSAYQPPAGLPVAYLIAIPKDVTVTRAKKAVRVLAATALRSDDHIRLGEGASARIITSDGVLPLRGPLSVSAKDFTPRSGRANATAPALQMALFAAPEKAQQLLARSRSGAGIRIYSPLGFTGDSEPVVLWKGEPGTYYDVSIFDELTRTNPPLRLSRVTSPVEFSKAWPRQALAADGFYRLRIEAVGNVLSATELTFRTLPRATPAPVIDPDDRLMASYEMLTASTPRLGDALVLLLHLPPEVAACEFAERLKLFVFGQLGYTEEFEAVCRRLDAAR